MGTDNTVANAVKWSFLAEFGAKLVLPISNMILARLLTPEMFGVVVTITMITSFADIFTDAGFQKYVIQHNFESDNERDLNANVAFWTNLVLSAFIWLLIIVFKDELADLVGNKGLGNVIALSSATIPITAFSSLQSALYKRDLNFKKLFQARMIGALVPLVITVPMAAILKDYRAMVIGTVSKTIIDAVVLGKGSKWKPKFMYHFGVLKKMFSFGIWTAIESILLWIISYVGTFLIGFFFSQHYVGLYKTAMTTVNQIISLISAATTTVLLSTLSRLQNDDEMFCFSFFKFQRMSAIFIIPMGIGVFLYRDLIVDIMLGDQWWEIKEFVGLWGAVSSIGVLWANYPCNAYVAKGKPKLSLIVQIIQISILIPTLLISSQYGFRTLYISRTLVCVICIFVNFIVCHFFTNISPLKMITNSLPCLISAFVMSAFAWKLRALGQNVVWQFVSILICAVVYFIVLFMFPKMRSEILETEKVRNLIEKFNAKKTR